MFERFARDARQVVVDAQGQCRRRGDEVVTPLHLLLSALAVDFSLATLLAAHGVTRGALERTEEGAAGLEPEAAEALQTLGIDLDTVREAVESSFGRGALDRPPARRGRRRHLPFGPDAKQALELSLREAIRLRHRSIGVEHVVLGSLRSPGPGLRTRLTALGVDVPALRGAVEQSLRPAA